MVVFPDEDARTDWDNEMLYDALGITFPLKTEDDEIEMWDVDMPDLS